jgi:mandelate racemase
MATETLTLRSIAARAVVAPLARPLRTAVGTIPAAPLVLIDLVTEEGVPGRSYIFGYMPATLGPLVSLIGSISEELKGRPVVPATRQRDLDRRFRLLGWQGLVGMAVGGVDMALWDALGRAAGQPVARLIGGGPVPVSAYDSYGAVDAKADAAALSASIESGFRAIKIKLGDGDVARDVATVRGVREIIGPDVQLMVDYNQSLTPAEALRRIAAIAPCDIAWIEEPVAAEDLEGHARVRAASPVRIQTGENWWFPRDMAKAIAAGACDYAMPDLMKIGGITGWLSAMGQAEAASMPMSSHLFVEASAHVLPVTPTAHWLEYLDVAGAVLADPLRPIAGTVTARGPGLGMEWDEAAVRRYAV